ncbi:hypothetical protein pqer_cds_1178 [Pandoravirus quercus]|uniref:Uncharacterized protein n=1 Tax=Pandoravirus quercus TaxID=2107709 RepID=A0A2U7UB83_9VIRU|nr:hypothetical protein pqer_cds_1178 [Pandoravirus quercus]AVK75600.1 hypothetical protein pqer_cds_1178 [Pandoravirus quercus]
MAKKKGRRLGGDTKTREVGKRQQEHGAGISVGWIFPLRFLAGRSWRWAYDSSGEDRRRQQGRWQRQRVNRGRKRREENPREKRR